MDANSLLRKWRSKQPPEEVRVPTVSQAGPAPLTHPQERLWLLQYLNPNSPFYNYCEVLLFSDELKTSVLIEALSLVVSRNKVFFHRFKQEDGQLVQVVDERIEFTPSYYGDKLDTSEVRSWARRKGRAPFDLSSGPLIRADLAELKDTGYALMLSFHHIIIDAWSVELFKQQLASAYSALITGETFTYSSPEREFIDYACEERKVPKGDEQRPKTKAPFDVVDPHPILPYDYKRPSRLSYAGDDLSMNVGEQFSRRVTEIVRKERVTDFTFYLSVFQLLLWKYGNERTYIGFPATRRNQPGTDKLIGFFTETALMLSELRGGESFSDLLAKTEHRVNALRAGEIDSFEDVVREMGMDRSLSENPIFQVMFVHHPKQFSEFRSPTLYHGTEVIPLGVSKFDLTLHIFSDVNEVSISFEYSTDLFFAETIKELLQQYVMLLKQVLVDPKLTLKGYSMTTPEQAQFFERVQNTNHYEKVHNSTVLDLIGKRFIEVSDQSAVSFDGEILTYGELNIESLKITRVLLADSYRNQSFIGIMLPRSLAYVVTILGILRAGKGYIPLDPDMVPVRLHQMIEDSEVSTIIAAQNVEYADLTSLNYSEITNQEPIAEDALPEIDPNSWAYLIYTSGSTGRPKGVAITHRNLISSVEARIDYYGEAPHRFLHVSPFFFDSSVAGLFWTLSEGCHLIVSEPRWEQDLQKAKRFLEDSNVTHTLMLPSLYEMLLESIPDPLKMLKTVIVAGETCTSTLALSHFKFSEARLFNEYGPTEGTIWCLVHRVMPSDVTEDRVPIGKPVRNTTAVVVNEQDQQVPRGVVGRLLISGPSVVNRYFSNDGDSNKKFRALAGFDHTLFYDTGDLVRINANGSFEFFGRADAQVKIRGHRVELSEIASTLASYDGINNAVVVLQERPQANEQPTREMPGSKKEDLLRYVESLTDEECKMLLRNWSK